MSSADRATRSGRVTVIVVNYNGYAFAKRCLEAVLNASYPDIEVILVDNGSAGGSVQKLSRHFRDDRLRFLALPSNLGPAAARNKAAEISTGEFLPFLDNDTQPAAGGLEPAGRRIK